MRSLVVAVVMIAGSLGNLRALPTMIRLGYPNCVSCHVSPQGGGLLNGYGRGIDQAQSLRSGEYKPQDNALTRVLSWGGRINQDLRYVASSQTDSSRSILRSRLFYRNVTQLNPSVRFSASVEADAQPPVRSRLPYEQRVEPGRIFVNSALLQIKARENLEVAFGRDALPTGLNLPDRGLFITSRNRLGYYDTPTQAKVFWWGKRYHISPYVFMPGGDEASRERESGGGLLAEFDPVGSGRVVVGTNLLRGSSRNADRSMTGVYARMGFGQWGLFAEHDFTRRLLDRDRKLNQSASFFQVFWALREWFVAYTGVERLRVGNVFPESRVAGRFDLTARLASHLTIGGAVRVEHDARTGKTGPVLLVQLAAKTVP